MSSLKRFLTRFRNSATRLHDEHERLNEEIAEHVALQTAENLRAGLPPAEARRQALLKFGAVATVAEDYRAERRFLFFDTLLHDLRFAVRMLRKSPGFTAVAILTLALGIGANTAIFSFIDAVLLRDLPVKDPQQLVLFRRTAHAKPKIHGSSGYGDCGHNGRDGACSFSVPFFKTIRAEADTFSGMAAFAGPIDVDFSGNGAASIAEGTYVSGDFFSTLGVNTFIGRPLALSDDSPSAPPVIVLNYAYWVRAFGADRSAVGRTVRLDNTAATIVGVTDPHFTNLTPGKTQDFFMPISLANLVRDKWAGHQDYLTDPSNWWVVMLGRLKLGVSSDQAQAAATTIFRNEMLHGATPAFEEADAPGIHLQPAQAGLNGETSSFAPALYLTMAIVAFILLIACANLAGLTLARSATRQKEMAVRLALGASHSRIIRQLLTESVLLSAIGGALGILLAMWGVDTIVALFANAAGRPFPFVVALDWRILVFIIAVVFAAGILFGLAPALRGSRLDLTPTLKEAVSSLPGSAAYSGRWFRLGDTLVIAQVALSIVVLIGAGLLVRTLRNLHNIDPGFDTRNILLFEIDPTIAGYTDQQTQQLYSNLQQRFAALPGVLSVSYSEDALLAGGTSGDWVHFDNTAPTSNVMVDTLPVGLSFFSTMRIPILAGRAFTSADFAAAIATNAAQRAVGTAYAKTQAASPPAPALATSYASAQQAYSHSAPVPVLINETFVRKYLHKQNPIGLHMGGPQMSDEEVQHPSPGYTIIGIVTDTKYNSVRRDIVPMMFLPLVSNEAHFELRTAANPTLLMKNVREIVSQAGDNLPLTDVRTQTEQAEQMLFQQRLMSRLSSFFGALALVLACIGLYGLLSYEVARRTREVGIRMALGAQRRDLLRLVVGQGILLALVGAAIGIAAALGVTRFISSMLFEVRPNDPATFISVAILLALVALVACYIPARRAMKVDPMIALRYE
jgi:predicted permease